ncbi:MAG: hypothetical protein CBB70_10755 [Planctomycetaceae bacterium TMED10]|nr:MAG: hypothetical protein CBB70_10755 [Planctomycetaceae bacterium TMED10]
MLMAYGAIWHPPCDSRKRSRQQKGAAIANSMPKILGNCKEIRPGRVAAAAVVCRNVVDAFWS